ncbi:S8 family serine peptidase [Oceanicella sp. SM1341]|uniref:S8 family serine peptidase n=1 Tax=Oceanicella sp. SM1341 TaxID=1548889 RepID=UPI001E42AE4B|nr:S8 family serine peptidase [Oceanicella sp. SM1341]
MTGMTRRARRMAGLAGGLALLLAGCADYALNPPPPEQIRADAGRVVDAREILALTASPESAASLRAGAEAEGFTFREQTALSGLGLWMLRFDIPEPLDGPGAIAALERLEPGATAGVNHAYRLATDEGSDAARFAYADALLDWPRGGCRAQGPVGMLDTGVERAAPGLAGARIVTRGFARGTPAATRHGTDVATLLADPRRLGGVTLYAAGVVSAETGDGEGAGGEAGVDSLIKGLDWLDSQGVRVVNVSLAGPYNKLLDRAVDRAQADGMVLVAAVGNDGPGAAPRYPAALGNVLGVTAVDARRHIYRKAVQGSYVDVAAPGVDIHLPGPGGGHFVSGTSIAAPFVTAWVASDPALYSSSVSELRSALAQSTLDLGAPGPDAVFGAGLLHLGPGC